MQDFGQRRRRGRRKSFVIDSRTTNSQDILRIGNTSRETRTSITNQNNTSLDSENEPGPSTSRGRPSRLQSKKKL